MPVEQAGDAAWAAATAHEPLTSDGVTHAQETSITHTSGETRKTLHEEGDTGERALETIEPSRAPAGVEIRQNNLEDVQHDPAQESSASTSTHTEQSAANKRGPMEPTSLSQDAQGTPNGAMEQSQPPSLDYSLRTRKVSIAIFWTLILIDSIAIPLVLYFCLHYLNNLSPNAVFSISTACLGGISIVEYVLRFWRLWKHTSTCRVIGARRWYLDWFHWNFSAAWIFIMAELIIGTSFEDPPIRLLAMPLSSMLFWFSLEIMLEDGLRYFGKPAPLRISSIQKGEPIRPGIYSIIEDVCAVDGSGGTAFRTRLDNRFKASHCFRQMLHRLSEVWAISMLVCAILTTIFVFTIHNEAAYVVGWTLPSLWAGVMTLWTFWYVKRALRYEQRMWNERTP